MEILYTPIEKENLSIALGFFDGIHKGHKKVIEDAVYYAKKNNLKSAVISFIEHPSCFLKNKKPEYIISIEDKKKFMEKLNIDYLYLLEFNDQFSHFSKNEYFDFLCKYTKPKAITTGFNHFFGKNKEGDTTFLQEICKKNNIIYQKILPIKIKDVIVSSSEIRKKLQNGVIEIANNMLGYDFYIEGKIIKGQQLGTKIGFKTINIEYPEKIIKLPFGVYKTYTQIENKKYPSISNWGIKPTFNKELKPILETHILNFNDISYGKIAKISFLKKIRDEKKFDTLEDLKEQISKDIELCIKNY